MDLLKLSHRFMLNGVALSGYEVAVTKSGSNAKATIFASPTATVRLPTNVMKTAADGSITVYVRPGSYRLTLKAANGDVLSQEDGVSATSSGVETRQEDSAVVAAAVGALVAATGLSVDVQRAPGSNLATLTFTLNAVSLAVTDAAASGSSASKKLFSFVQAGIVPLGCRQNYTAFAEGAALTGGAGDASFVMGLGSVAANAGDGALTGTEVDFADVTGAITLAGGTGAGTKFSGSLAPLDGTTTAKDLYLNWSGTAATIDANSTISVTGTIQLTVLLLGDD